MGRVQDKVAIVTGGSQGIGEAIVRRLHEEGAKVVVTDILVEKGQEVADSLDENAVFIELDVTDPNRWDEVLAEVEEKFGKIDVLVNNAGFIVNEKFSETQDENYKKTIGVNQDAVFYSMKRVHPYMMRAGGGSIINMSSGDGLVGSPNSGAYNAAKFAVTGMTKAAALDYARDNIRVNSVHPGLIRTAILDGLDQENFRQVEESMPVGRVGEPIEVANMVLFLASDESTYSTGSEFKIDGGHTAQ